MIDDSARLAVIHLFEDCEDLDAVGPWEVLAYWSQKFPEDGWSVVTASTTGDAVTTAKGLRVTPHHKLADLPTPDLFLEPGGRGSRPLSRDEAHLATVRRIASEGALMTSVCTGALVYASAGLLKGRLATTHHMAFDELLERDPTVIPREEDRWVDDGDVVTAAGISAGIDMALYLVGRLVTPERALQVQRAIQYDPRPPRWE